MRPWDRKLWGIRFSGTGGDPPMLLGGGWHDHLHKPLHDDEPTRALLFWTRKAARAWCLNQHSKYSGRTDCCAQWRFSPVRVRETVTVLPKDGET